MCKNIFILLAGLLISPMVFPQMVKTVHLTFSEDLFPLYENSDGTVSIATNFFSSLSYSYNGNNYTDDDCYWTDESLEPFQPCLPWEIMTFPMDDEEEFATYSVEKTEVLIREDVLLAYSCQPSPTATEDEDADKGKPIYKDKNYPEENIAYLGTDGGSYDHTKNTVFQIYPFRYDAAEKKLYLLTDIKLNITLKSDKNPISPYDLDGDGILTLNDITMLINIYLEKSE